MFGDKRRPPATVAAEIDRVIGLNIKRARENMRLGQHEVATLLGLSVHVLARYEDGEERAPASVLLEMTRHLECQLTELFAGMPSMEADDDFQGSRPSPTSFAETAPAQVAPGYAPADIHARSSGSASAMRDDARVVADIIKAFSDLTNPALRERLLGLLNALA